MAMVNAAPTKSCTPKIKEKTPRTPYAKFVENPRSLSHGIVDERIPEMLKCNCAPRC